MTRSQTLRPGKTPARWAGSGPSPTQGEQTLPRPRRPSHTPAAGLLTRPHTRAGAGARRFAFPPCSAHALRAGRSFTTRTLNLLHSV